MGEQLEGAPARELRSFRGAAFRERSAGQPFLRLYVTCCIYVVVRRRPGKGKGIAAAFLLDSHAAIVIC